MIRDKQLFLIALTQEIILAAIAYFMLSIVFGNLLSLFSSTQAVSSNPNLFLGAFVSSFVSILGLEVIILLISVFFAIAILTKAYYGTQMSIGQAFSNAIKRYLHSLVLVFILFLVFFVSYLFIFVLGFFSPIFFVLFLPYLVIAPYAGIMLSLALPFLVIGKKGIIDLLKMSWSTVKGNWWQIFFTLLIIAIVYYIIILLLEIPLLFQIFSSVFSSFPTSVNSTTSQPNMKVIMTDEFNAFNSPLFFIIEAVTTILDAWFIIAIALIYKGMIAPQKTTATASRKKSQ